MTDITASTPVRSRLWLSLPLVFGLLVYAATMARLNEILADPDTYWHITLGNWILAHHAVPHRDLWSFTKAGAPFVAMEWLSEVVIAAIYDVFGWAGLTAMAALAAAAAVTLQVRFLLRYLTPAYAGMAAALTWSMVLGHILARPHIFSLPLIVVWTAALVAARRNERAPPWRLVPLMTLWSNLHASYLLGLGLAGLLGVEAVLAAPDWPGRLRAARGWGLFCAVAFAAALLTPYGITGLLQPLKLLRMSFALSILTEWQSPNFQQYQPLELWILVALAAAFLLSWRLPATRLGIMLLLLHMALAHRRHAEILGLVAPLLLAPALAPQLADRPGQGRALALVDRIMAEMAKPASIGGGALAAAMLFLISAAALLPRHLADERADITPTAALAAIAARRITGPVLNDYGFGGYLIFRGIKTFIDGRADFYGDPFIKRYYDAVSLMNGKLPELLQRYHITWTLFAPHTPAIRLIEHLPGWHRLYADKVAIVDVRDGAARRRAVP